MFSTPFYHNTIRKTVIAFGALFDNLYVTRTQNGNPIKIKVPIIYSGKEKFLARYKDTLNRETKDNTVVQTILPKMGFEITSMEYDASRKKPSVNKRTIKNVQNGVTSYSTLYTEVPYNINFTLYAYVRYMDDGLQIAEQILPYFTPDFTVAIKQDVTGELNEKMNIPFVLTGVAPDNSYEGDLESPYSRMIMWSYNITARINLFGPVSSGEVILDIDNNFYKDLEMEEPMGTINILATPNTNNGYDITETSTLE